MEKTNENWAHLTGSGWSYLLQCQPRFADKCDWSKLDATAWLVLLRCRPEFAEKCDMAKFTGYDIVRIFREKSSLSSAGLYGRVDECDFSTLSASDWCEVLAMRPDFADKFEASTHDWSADTEEDPEEVPPEED